MHQWLIVAERLQYAIVLWGILLNLLPHWNVSLHSNSIHFRAGGQSKWPGRHHWPFHSFLHLTLGHIVISEDSDVCRSQSPSEHDCISPLTAPTLSTLHPGPTLHNTTQPWWGTGWVMGPSPLTLPPLTRVNMYSSLQVLAVIKVFKLQIRIPTKKQRCRPGDCNDDTKIKMPTFWITL